MPDDRAVRCVVLRSDGGAYEVTSAHGRVHTLFPSGSSMRIVGALPEIGVVAVSASGEGAPPNAHALPADSFEPGVAGDVVLARTQGRHARPVDVSLDDVRRFVPSVAGGTP